MDLVIELVKATASVLQPLIIFGLLCLAFILLNRYKASLSETMAALGIKKVGFLGITAEFVELRLEAAASIDPTDRSTGAEETRLPVRDEDKPEIRRTTERLGPLALGAHILWFDYFPSNNLHERTAFTHLGIDVQTSRTKDVAMTELLDPSEKYHLFISYWGQRVKQQGPELLKEIRSKKLAIPFLFYTSSERLEEKRIEASTLGAQGVTASPAELYRWVLTWLALR
jgi:hypothetical protein